jgi:GR25 family glycosyltransferase involved in LPS biosynthesis
MYVSSGHSGVIDSVAWNALIKSRQANLRTSHASLTNGAIGCYLSHYKIWREIFSDNDDDKQVLILEEDARLAKNAEKAFSLLATNPSYSPPANVWDILLLGGNHSYSHDSSRKKNKEQGWVRVTTFVETHAYIIKYSTIKKIMNRMFPITKQLDWKLSDLSKDGTLRVWAHDPPIFIQDKSQGTTIQTTSVA